jgi:hypothetical protein
LKLFCNQIQELKAVRDSSEQQIYALKDEMDELRTWKEKVRIGFSSYLATA